MREKAKVFHKIELKKDILADRDDSKRDWQFYWIKVAYLTDSTFQVIFELREVLYGNRSLWVSLQAWGINLDAVCSQPKTLDDKLAVHCFSFFSSCCLSLK